MIIRAKSLTETLWKNGGGTTTEIARGCANDAIIAANDFDWRLSFARVESDGPFSEFKGYDRWLTVWRGEGLELGSEVLRPFKPFHFSGDNTRQARLIHGPVVDLGLIYRRGKIRASMTEITHLDRKFEFDDFVGGATYDLGFLFVVSGVLNVQDELLEMSDTLRFTRPQSQSLLPHVKWEESPKNGKTTREPNRLLFVRLNF